MIITRIETIRLTKGIEVHAGSIGWLWVRLHTHEGLVGLGETYPTGQSAEAVVLESLAPVLLGRDPRNIERLWADMFQKVSYHGWGGAEMRAISAVDLALWDLLGKSTGQPVWRLLGGRCREHIPTYNTCYDHIYDFRTDAAKLARDLLAQGINAMKIWPFDEIALAEQGQRISNAQLEKGLQPVRAIRDDVGDQIQIAMEFHGYWNLPCAIRIAKALEPLGIVWLEEMLPQDNIQSYRNLAERTSIPLILSERLMTRWQFREVIESGAAAFINPDLCWCGGLTEARKIASHADTYYLPVAPHNCGGPVLHFASVHWAASLPNLFLLESVRRHYLREYVSLVSGTCPAKDGNFVAPDAPGLGVELNPVVLQSSDVLIRSASA